MFFSLLACLPDLNGPVVLATGLGQPRSISLSAQDQLLVASHDGLYAVDYYGAVTPEPGLVGLELQQVVAHDDRLYVLDAAGRIGWRMVASQSWSWVALTEKPKALMAWSKHRLILVYDDSLELWSPEHPAPEAWRSGFSSILDTAYDTESGCGGVILATTEGLVRSCDGGFETISSLVLDQVSSSQNQIWGLQKGQLGLVAGERLQESRSFPATDMVFGASTLFPSHLLYGVMDKTLELTQCLPEKLAD